MKAFITGGTGFVGATLTRRLLDEGHEITLLTRSLPSEHPTRRGVQYEHGDPTQKGPWQEVGYALSK